jgi:Coenzyme PQQ synthesis protein D (PqqD)
MPTSFTKRVIVPPETLVNVVGDETVIMSLKSQCFFGLDEVGTGMWKALTSSQSIQAAYDALLREYDVEGDSLRHDLEQLVEQLIERQLIEVSGE